MRKWPRQLVLRLAVPAAIRARLFDTSGRLIADSRDLGPAALQVEARELPPPDAESGLGARLSRGFDWLLRVSLNQPRLPPYKETGNQSATDYDEVLLALAGETGFALREMSGGELIVSVALPVQRFKLVLGALMLSTGAADIEARVREVRIDILQVFGLALLVTILLSVYLSRTIARRCANWRRPPMAPGCAPAAATPSPISPGGRRDRRPVGGAPRHDRRSVRSPGSHPGLCRRRCPRDQKSPVQHPQRRGKPGPCLGQSESAFGGDHCR